MKSENTSKGKCTAKEKQKSNLYQEHKTNAKNQYTNAWVLCSSFSLTVLIFSNWQLRLSLRKSHNYQRRRNLSDMFSINKCCNTKIISKRLIFLVLKSTKKFTEKTYDTVKLRLIFITQQLRSHAAASAQGPCKGLDPVSKSHLGKKRIKLFVRML